MKEGSSGDSVVLLASVLDRPLGDVVADLEAIVIAAEQGKRPAWGPDGHDNQWWMYHLARSALEAHNGSRTIPE